MKDLFAVVFIVIGYFLYRWWFTKTWDDGAPFEGMPPDVVERAVDMAGVGSKDVFYDLGSGDGRVVIAAAMRGAKSYGVEIDSLRVFYSRIWILLLRLYKNAKIIRGDVFKENLSKATVICCYLLPETHDKLKVKFKKELKKGTKIIAVGFKFNGWKPVETDPRGPVYGSIYLYEI